MIEQFMLVAGLLIGAITLKKRERSQLASLSNRDFHKFSRIDG